MQKQQKSRPLVKRIAANEIAIEKLSIICPLVCYNTTVSRVRTILIGENDTVRIVGTRAIVGSASVDGVSACVAHQREFEEFSGRAIGEVECLAVVE